MQAGIGIEQLKQIDIFNFPELNRVLVDGGFVGSGQGNEKSLPIFLGQVLDVADIASAAFQEFLFEALYLPEIAVIKKDLPIVFAGKQPAGVQGQTNRPGIFSHFRNEKPTNKIF